MDDDRDNFSPRRHRPALRSSPSTSIPPRAARYPVIAHSSLQRAAGTAGHRRTDPARPVHGTAAGWSATLDPAKGWESRVDGRRLIRPTVLSEGKAKRLVSR